MTSAEYRGLIPKPGTKKKKGITLIAKAQEVFNKFIRERDKNKPCISCGAFHTLQAGHFYSAGHHNALRFNEDNVHGQCLRCNYYLSGNLSNYRVNLIKKIGIQRVEKLDQIASIKKAHKLDRFYLQEIISNYKNLITLL